MSVVETTIDGRYQVIARIAAGGMGEVYRAQDAVLQREVAVKILHPQLAGDRGFVDRFRREARAAAILNHPNIVGVYDWGATDGTYYMIMEYVRGTNLRAILLEHRRLEPAQVVEVSLQVLAALDHAHGHGIVHRDVKPENILIAEDGKVKVADFGLARAFADSTISQAEGTVTGTVQYLAPEQVQGEPADPRTDLYAIGIVIFELLTGTPPYTGETSLAIAYQHLSSRVAAPSSRVPSLDPALDRAVLRATAPDRDERPASARALAEELRAAGGAVPPAARVSELAAAIPATEAVPQDRAPTVTIPKAMSVKARRRRALMRAALVLSIVGAVVGAAWGIWTYAVPHYTEVPDVAGLSVQAATDRLEQGGFDVVVAEAVFSSDVEAGLVVRSIPPDGTRLELDQRVTIVPSKGPELVPVPRVTGRSEDEARRILGSSDFKVDVERAFDDEVPSGNVIAQNPEAGTRIEKGSPVTITVSRGPELVAIPDVRGQPEDVAVGTLQSLGLAPQVTHQFSTEVPRGEVVATEPGPGTELPKGTAVTVVVSQGPETFPMPRVLGLSSEEATERLEALGLVVEEVRLPGSVGDEVQGQDPSQGETVEQGQEVTIYIGGE